ncbi:unnamed protein product [Mytilus edulis]|uniref:Fibrinogen C-terminal domain-containing protein n=1 Tax=Mytilus edulis TaxID=6550 RepID=A0A8S3U4N0_MYTED|nr:unnamed protein product [Mytilus edulis]
MVTAYKESLQKSKAVYEEDLAHLVGGFKSRVESLFSDLAENVTDLIDILEERSSNVTQTITEKHRPINLPRDCSDIKESNTRSGVYTISIDTVGGKQVYCDMDVDGGGWIVIQRRSNWKVKFERTWNEYENGFGDVAGEHWLGNKLERQSSGKFSTRDRHNDGESRNLADGYGPWWYKSGSHTWLLDDQRENYWGNILVKRHL